MILNLKDVMRTSFILILLIFNFISAQSSIFSIYTYKDYPREKTLYVDGFLWFDPLSFNPLAAYSDWPVLPGNNLLYEPLVMYNSLTGELEPQIGTLHKIDNTGVTVILNSRASWSDGSRVTGVDVKWSYNVNMKNSKAPFNYIKRDITEVTLDSTIVNGEKLVLIKFSLNKNGSGIPFVLEHLSKVSILPEKVFKPDLSDFKNLQMKSMMHRQIVSGPYNLYGYNNNHIALIRRDDYWGNEVLYKNRKASPQYIIHPILSPEIRDTVNFWKDGYTDITARFNPDIKEEDTLVRFWSLEEQNYYPSAITTLKMNMSNPLLSSTPFRQALALSINYSNLNKREMTNCTEEIYGGLIIPAADEKHLLSIEDIKECSFSRYSKKEAVKKLKLQGFRSHYKKKVLHCMTDSKGDTLNSLSFLIPKGWYDFELMAEKIVSDIRAAGIDIRIDTVNGRDYYKLLKDGKYDLYIETAFEPRSPATLLKRFKEHLPENGNLRNQVDSLMHSISFSTDTTIINSAYKKLNVIYMENQFAIPLAYRPIQFYTVQNKWWKGFPSKEDPYAPPVVPGTGSGTKTLWNINPIN